MNILQIISNSHINGTGRHLLLLTRGLQRLGHSITVVCPPGDWLPSQLRQADIPVVEIPMGRSPLLQMARMARRRKIDLIHTHATRAAYAGLLLGSLTRKPIIATVHIVSHDIVYRRLLPRGANQILTVSDFVRNTLLAHGAPPSRLHTIYPGTDFGLFGDAGVEASPCRALLPGEPLSREGRSVRAELNLSPEAALIGVFGNVCAQKGQDLLLQAAPSSLARCPKAHFVFAGYVVPEDRQALLDRAARGKVKDRVRILGVRQDVARLMTAMDVIVVPSSLESFGMVSIEAMALSKPVVAARVGGIPEVVLDGETGLLVEREPAALANGILCCLLNPARSAAMGRQGQARVRAHFTAARMTGEISCLYEKVADDRQ